MISQPDKTGKLMGETCNASKEGQERGQESRPFII